MSRRFTAVSIHGGSKATRSRRDSSVFEIVQHTADVRLRVSASTIEELFRDALRGLTAVMRPSAGGSPITRTIQVEALDRTALLIDFLGDALLRTHIDYAAFDDVVFTTLTDVAVDAQLSGFAPVEFDEDVKAVTYHEANVRFEHGLWMTTIVLDI